MDSNDSDGIRPVIGLPTYMERASFGSWDVPSAVLHRQYPAMVERAGGIPVLLPPVGVARPELVARLDGLLLTGGADVDPARYGGTPEPSLGYTRPDRDDSEFELFRLARAAGLPVLAVCRGLQLVNVALGGTLIEHLPAVVGHERHSGGPGSFTEIEVTTTPGSAVAEILGARVTARCHHHQAVAELGGSLVATAHAADGTVEAVETRSGPMLLGVQWHPEADAGDDRLVRALVVAASETVSAKRAVVSRQVAGAANAPASEAPPVAEAAAVAAQLLASESAAAAVGVGVAEGAGVGVGVGVAEGAAVGEGVVGDGKERER